MLVGNRSSATALAMSGTERGSSGGERILGGIAAVLRRFSSWPDRRPR
ncbi:hypothetical protein [Streptomyces sp. NPDC093149]